MKRQALVRIYRIYGASFAAVITACSSFTPVPDVDPSLQDASAEAATSLPPVVGVVQPPPGCDVPTPST